jgi:phage terminase small subunit
MGRRGPQPRPTALKVLRGNPGRRPLNPTEPKPQPLESIEPPAWRTAEAAAIWREDAPHVHQLGLLTRLDRRQFGVYRTHQARWQALCAKGADDHTTIGLLRREAEVVQRLAARFGLDPASRTALKVETPKAADPLLSFVRNA